MNDILIIGIATVDAIARPIDEFPAPGGLRFFKSLTMSTGGNAINCSIALARLGVPCNVIARVGSDTLGDFVIAELTRHNIATDTVARDTQVSTAFTFVAVAGNGERCFLHTAGADDTLCRQDIAPNALQGRRFVFMTGTMLMNTMDGELTAAVLAEAQAAGAATLLDTVFVESTPRDEWRRRVFPALPHVTFFIPSEPEAMALLGMPINTSEQPLSPQTLTKMAQEFRDRGAGNVIIKLGSRGAFCLLETGATHLVPPFSVPKVADTTGAGDCWSAGFLAGLREGLPPEKAIRLGNAVAAHSIQAVGATAGVKPLAAIKDFIASH